MSRQMSAGQQVGDESLDLNLTVRERIDYPFLLANQILNIQRVIIKDYYDPAEIVDAVETLIAMIPATWRLTDEDFQDDIKNARVTYPVDIRPSFGGITATHEICEKMGWAVSKEESELNHFKAFNAVINLLDRKRMLTRRNWIEKVTGEPAEKDESKPEPTPVLPQHIRDAQERIKNDRALLRQVDFTAKDLKELDREIETLEKVKNGKKGEYDPWNYE